MQVSVKCFIFIISCWCLDVVVEQATDGLGELPQL